jgi:hypothetical protein
MRLLLALALAALYTATCLTLSGVLSGGFAWWFFAPALMVFGAGMLWKLISIALPLPWVEREGRGLAPRRVRLSWRAAVGLPAVVPALFIPWNMLTILHLHFSPSWVRCLEAMTAAAILAWVAIRRAHEFRLVRSGEVATAVVDQRDNSDEATDRITYHFSTACGTTVAGRTSFLGHDIRPGTGVPVYYNPTHPTDHVAACATWFEAA